MEVERLLKNHSELRDKLINIPNSREITYREDIIEGNLIGKPRFTPKLYQWPPELLTQLHNHLDYIWQYFHSNSYWFDDELKEILLFRTRKISKKSVIFLLERDVWETSEVFGDYLIEDLYDTTKISYFRFNHRFKTFDFPNLRKRDLETRKNWICKDAIEQIRNQFNLIWNRLEIEIITCQTEIFHPAAKTELTDEMLSSEIEICKSLADTAPRAALLLLGNLEEMWLLKAINKPQLGKKKRIMELAKDKIPTPKLPLFVEIRDNYNKLKHSTTYTLEPEKIKNWIREFIPLMKNS